MWNLVFLLVGHAHSGVGVVIPSFTSHPADDFVWCLLFFLIFQDKETLTDLLEVIADPEVYYTYSEDEHSTLLPQSFYKLLHNKVTRFFNLEQ